MLRIVVSSLTALMLCGGVCCASDALRAVDYLTDVKPVLQRSCYACHGALKQEGGLRLDTADAAIAGGDSGSAIVPDKSVESILVDRIADTDEATRMPQEGAALSEAEIGAIRAWIDNGADHPNEQVPPDPLQHWSFIPPQRPETPPVSDDCALARSQNPIDRIIAARHKALDLSAVDKADRYTLLRRVFIDLTGLPPTRDEVDRFVNDSSEDAYERVVDRLLASPEYGQRWGRHWMDVWRYSDWDGHLAQVRESQPFVWRWRDWIVESLNDDKPYDRMIHEMIAGDEIAPDDPSILRATGYLARNYHRFNRNIWLENTVEHSGKAFLGLTLNCAKCHDHKYDPIAQTEYYAWRAAFEPYDVRTDPVPGQPDTSKDGLTRVYDAHADAPTYFFVRGDERQADKENPLAPALLQILGGQPLKSSPVDLPLQAWYPALREFAQQDRIAAIDGKLQEARAALNKALEAREPSEGERSPEDHSPERATSGQSEQSISQRLVEGRESEKALERKDDDRAQRAAARRAKKAAESSLKVAETELKFVNAALAADIARHATPPADNAPQLIEAAMKAERVHKAAFTRHALLLARHAKEKAEINGARARRLARLDEAIREAEKKYNEAAAALEKDDCSSDYTPLGPTFPRTSTGRRSALAAAITDRANPLAARVAVNHIWLRHFGAPIVPTVFDFGHNGKPPSHPELLDWLAVEFMEGGWQMKPIHRLIVSSQVYQLKSTHTHRDSHNPEIDRDNVYLWRMNPRRLEAEAVRDTILFVAGKLDQSMGGPDLDPATAFSIPRRSVYFRHSKEKRVPFLSIFDQGSVIECYRRAETIVPQQALALANSELVAESTRPIFERISKQLGDDNADDERYVEEAFLHILGRPCRRNEKSLCVDFLHEEQTADSIPVRERLVHVLLNHHDFVTLQ